MPLQYGRRRAALIVVPGRSAARRRLGVEDRPLAVPARTPGSLRTIHDSCDRDRVTDGVPPRVPGRETPDPAGYDPSAARARALSQAYKPRRVAPPALAFSLPLAKYADFSASESLPRIAAGRGLAAGPFELRAADIHVQDPGLASNSRAADGRVTDGVPPRARARDPRPRWLRSVGGSSEEALSQAYKPRTMVSWATLEMPSMYAAIR